MQQVNIFYEAEVKWLHHARRWAVEKMNANPEKGLTVEDVLHACPRPIGVSRKANAKVFKSDVFMPIGFTRALHDGANGHVLRVWQRNMAYFPIDEEA